MIITERATRLYGPTPPAIRCAVFDVDGTLVRSADLHTRASRTLGACVKYNVAEPTEDQKASVWGFVKTVVGIPIEEHAYSIVSEYAGKNTYAYFEPVLSRLFEKYDLGHPGVYNGDVPLCFYAAFEGMMLNEYRNNIPDLFPSVNEYLRLLQSSGIPAYAGTCNFRSIPLLLTGHYGLQGYFKDIFGGVVGRPDPYKDGKTSMLRIAQGLHSLNEEQVAMFGDVGRVDMAASKLGGSRFVGVGISDGNKDAETDLIEHGADYVVRDMQEWYEFVLG